MTGGNFTEWVPVTRQDMFSRPGIRRRVGGGLVLVHTPESERTQRQRMRTPLGTWEGARCSQDTGRTRVDPRAHFLGSERRDPVVPQFQRHLEPVHIRREPLHQNLGLAQGLFGLRPCIMRHHAKVERRVAHDRMRPQLRHIRKERLDSALANAQPVRFVEVRDLPCANVVAWLGRKRPMEEFPRQVLLGLEREFNLRRIGLRVQPGR